MAGNSQRCPTGHFSHEISRMEGKLCNFLTKLLQSLYYAYKWTTFVSVLKLVALLFDHFGINGIIRMGWRIRLGPENDI